MNKRPQTFSATRPLTASHAPLQPKKAHPLLKKPLPTQEKKEEPPRPEWNSNLNENPYKISRAEVLQRKLNAKSKHELAAKEELQQKLESLKQGRVPEEYKPYTNKGTKKFSSNEAFITNKELKKEYENRCYLSTTNQDQTFYGAKSQRQLGDPINFYNETTDVKTTFAHKLVERPIQSGDSNLSLSYQPIQSVSHFKDNAIPNNKDELFNNYQSTMNTNRDFENLLGMIQDTKKELKMDQTSSEEEEEPEMAGESQYIEVPKDISETGQRPKVIAQVQNFDYLDYKENEERLERLKTQNFSLYSNFLEPSNSINQVNPPFIEVKSTVTQVKPIQVNVPKLSINLDGHNPQQQHRDDLDLCFQNLNNLLGQSSNTEITPIKPDLAGSQAPTYREGIETSPSSLMPHYGELMIGYSKQAIPIKKPEDVLYNKAQNLHQKPSSQLVEEDPEIARMREMLLSTQQDIDRIILGTDNISNLYNQSKEYTQSYPSVFTSNQTSAVIKGSQPLKEISLAPVHYTKQPFTTTAGAVASSRFQENIHPNMMSSHFHEEEELTKPRAYPFLQQQSDPNSVSLRTNIAVVPPTYHPPMYQQQQRSSYNY